MLKSILGVAYDISTSNILVDTLFKVWRSDFPEHHLYQSDISSLPTIFTDDHDSLSISSNAMCKGRLNINHSILNARAGIH